MIWLFLHARSGFFRKHFLDCFKQCRRNNWRKASVVPFALVVREAQIYATGEHFGDGSFGRWRSFRRYAVIRQKVGDTAESVRPFGVFLKRFSHDTRFGWVRFDISRFGIIHIAKGSAHQPLASAKMEYHEMMLYASKDVIFSVKAFIENPVRDNFLKTILTMRQDLSNRSDLDLDNIILEVKSKS